MSNMSNKMNAPKIDSSDVCLEGMLALRSADGEPLVSLATLYDFVIARDEVRAIPVEVDVYAPPSTPTVRIESETLPAAAAVDESRAA